MEGALDEFRTEKRVEIDAVIHSVVVAREALQVMKILDRSLVSIATSDL